MKNRRGMPEVTWPLRKIHTHMIRQNPRILLLQPPVEDFYTTDVRLQPLGLAYLKAAILRELPGAIVRISDHHGGKKKRKTVSLPAELRHLRSIYADDDRSPFSSFFQFYHFGSTPKEIQKEVLDFSPDLVGISSLFSPYYDQVIRVARAVKEAGPFPVVCGGSHATSHPKSLLSDPSIDYVIRGEGEIPIVRLIQSITGNLSLDDIPGLSWKKDNIIIHSNCENTEKNQWSDLIPDFSDFDENAYLYEGEKIAFLQVSRGCPANCSFCSVHPVFGRRHRKRSVDQVIKEMNIRYDEGYRVFDFEDDNLTFSRNHALELFRSIASAFKGKSIRLFAMNGLYYPKLDEEILMAMKEAGFTDLNLSMVSTNERILNDHARNIDKDFEKLVRKAHSMGFRIAAYLIIGLPGENKLSILNTIAKLSSLPALLGASPFYRTPGMPLTDGIEFDRESLFRGRLTAMEPSGDLSMEEIHTLFIMIRIINYIKSSPVKTTSLLESLNSLRDKSNPDRRAVELIEILFESGLLYTGTPADRKVRSGFDPDIAESLLEQIHKIEGREGQVIHIKKPPPHTDD